MKQSQKCDVPLLKSDYALPDSLISSFQWQEKCLHLTSIELKWANWLHFQAWVELVTNICSISGSPSIQLSPKII